MNFLSGTRPELIHAPNELHFHNPTCGSECTDKIQWMIVEIPLPTVICNTIEFLLIQVGTSQLKPMATNQTHTVMAGSMYIVQVQPLPLVHNSTQVLCSTNRIKYYSEEGVPQIPI